jgi:hypothetical protein
MIALPLPSGHSRGRVAVVALALATLIFAATPSSQTPPAPNPLPARLTDAEFWRLVTEFSEPNGYFRSDNLVSNERPFQQVVPALVANRRGGAYLGVAPDQNFTYILAVDPAIAFIVDIRRNAMLQHLMYKVLFEVSRDRAEFVSRLFSRPRPRALPADAPASHLLAAIDAQAPDEAFYRANLREMEERLTRFHRFTLTPADLEALGGVYGMFYRFGPGLTYSSSSGRIGRNMPSYAELQAATDAEGVNHAYLANEAQFARMKAFQERNLLVPIVGDFAGPKALRAVGRFLAQHDTVVTAFYTSNVEQYLFQAGVEPAFYANLATLPLDSRSTIIRSVVSQTRLDPIQALLRSVEDGKIRTYADITSRGVER